MIVNSLTSSKVPVHKDYYSLPVCKPEKIVQTQGNIGTILSGEYYSNTPISFKMLEDLTTPQVICKVTLSQEDIDNYVSVVKDQYLIQWCVFQLCVDL